MTPSKLKIIKKTENKLIKLKEYIILKESKSVKSNFLAQTDESFAIKEFPL